uniref:Uncharacterized protein n=1 Tax=Pyxicephalus adspersus TaxID=30357 RepID=A0AAV2ZQN6_PYXAD|nr:TPA: hypothetical protein GDO54_005093 [Pyxicephalus adspersus]
MNMNFPVSFAIPGQHDKMKASGDPKTDHVCHFTAGMPVTLKKISICINAVRQKDQAISWTRCKNKHFFILKTINRLVIGLFNGRSQLLLLKKLRGE